MLEFQLYKISDKYKDVDVEKLFLKSGPLSEGYHHQAKETGLKLVFQPGDRPYSISSLPRIITEEVNPDPLLMLMDSDIKDSMTETLAPHS